MGGSSVLTVVKWPIRNTASHSDKPLCDVGLLPLPCRCGHCSVLSSIMIICRLNTELSTVAYCCCAFPVAAFAQYSLSSSLSHTPLAHFVRLPYIVVMTFFLFLEPEGTLPVVTLNYNEYFTMH